MSNLTPPTAAVLIRSLSSILTYDKELKPTELKPKTSVILNLIIWFLLYYLLSHNSKRWSLWCIYRDDEVETSTERQEPQLTSSPSSDVSNATIQLPVFQLTTQPPSVAFNAVNLMDIPAEKHQPTSGGQCKSNLFQRSLFSCIFFFLNFVEFFSVHFCPAYHTKVDASSHSTRGSAVYLNIVSCPDAWETS